MSGLTITGFDRKRLVDILADLEAAQKAIFGDNIDLEPESRFGQINALLSETISDAWEGQEAVYNAFRPSFSEGVSLSDLVQLNGIERDAGDNSTVDATVTGTVGLSIPSGSLASVVGTDEMFETLDTVVIPGAGFIDVAMASVNKGPIAAAIGTLTQIETPIFGWASITNAAAATLGRLEETDPQLLVRRQQSTSAGGNNISDALAAQLLNLADVTDAIVINNRTSGIVDGIDPHSFAAIVIGGTEADIVATIWANTPQGIDSSGDLSATITDGQGFPQIINYFRADDVDIYFEITLTTNSSYPSDGDDQVKAAIVTYAETGLVNDNLIDESFTGFGIYQDVILSQFYSAINSVKGITAITICMNTTGAPVVETSNITIAITEISRYDVANITIV